jgi:hypothetical protein
MTLTGLGVLVKVGVVVDVNVGSYRGSAITWMSGNVAVPSSARERLRFQAVASSNSDIVNQSSDCSIAGVDTNLRQLALLGKIHTTWVQRLTC